ncbi:MAG TPA: RNA polymerase sigma factor [Acidimicrobiales bacterium]|jgi:RNA polymerase sigma-70 factor (ECF subfamily)|nr:RNA polymerase sigma factor [Acidimicrobiales bacterium]
MGDTERAEATDALQIEASLTRPDAFAALFDRHSGHLHRYISKRVGRRDVEDLVGETFAVAFRSRRTYDLTRPDARPWLFGIATNLVRHHWRSEGRRLRREGTAMPIVEDYENPSEEAVSNVFFRAHAEPIARALGQLDDVYLDVLLLVAGPGFSYEEVSVALGIPVGTVRSRLSRARRQLRELLGASGQYLDEESPAEAPSNSTEGPP